MRNDPKILLVDDMPSARKQIEACLRKIGYTPDIDYRCPQDPSMRFGCAMPSADELNDYDLALVDLELFPAEDPVDYHRDDLRGGTEVLPYLRQSAPWLPVLAESRLYNTAAEHFLAIAGSFGFDGHLPRSLFADGKLTRTLWETLLQQAEEHRLAHAHVESRTIGVPLVVDISAPDRKAIEATLPGWEEVVRAAFPFAERVVLEVLPGGYSGAAVLLARVTDNAVPSRGRWIVKLSDKPSKLHQEATAHQRMVRSGYDFAKGVHLLWPVVIRRGRVACLVYQFAADTCEAAVTAKEHGAAVVAKRLYPLLEALYGRHEQVDGIAANVLDPWLPEAATLRKASGLSGARCASLLNEMAGDAKPGSDLQKPVTYSRNRLHGDLHLRNVLLGKTDVLIDFARSQPGPIAEDLAKLAMSVMIELPAAREGFTSSADLELMVGMKPLWDCLAPLFSFTHGDRLLFKLALIAHAARTLSYTSTEPEVRAWLIDALADKP
jgi:CheY-like chemotaxis protein